MKQNQLNPIQRELRTVGRMIGLYCHYHHPVAGAKKRTESPQGLCPSCSELLEYARLRLENCPYGPEKPACDSCQIHCYRTDYRTRIREVMRFAGPRMMGVYPGDALRHLLQKFRSRS